jgi:hypothetical protein
MMRVSLERFLRTGQLGDLTPGMSRGQIHALLGDPDDVGGTSRKYRRPCIWLYGSIELCFRQSLPQDFYGVFWDAAEKGPVRLPAHCVIEDWELLPGMPRPEVESWLLCKGIEIADIHPPPKSPTTVFLLYSRVRISFDDQEHLYAISAGF